MLGIFLLVNIYSVHIILIFYKFHPIFRGNYPMENIVMQMMSVPMYDKYF